MSNKIHDLVFVHTPNLAKTQTIDIEAICQLAEAENQSFKALKDEYEIRFTQEGYTKVLIPLVKK